MVTYSLLNNTLFSALMQGVNLSSHPNLFICLELDLAFRLSTVLETVGVLKAEGLKDWLNRREPRRS